jgi:hypothetical protein
VEKDISGDRRELEGVLAWTKLPLLGFDMLFGRAGQYTAKYANVTMLQAELE